MAVIHNQRCHIQLLESVPTQPGDFGHLGAG